MEVFPLIRSRRQIMGLMPRRAILIEYVFTGMVAHVNETPASTSPGGLKSQIYVAPQISVLSYLSYGQ
jgi:hypothetical protein